MVTVRLIISVNEIHCHSVLKKSLSKNIELARLRRKKSWLPGSALTHLFTYDRDVTNNISHSP